MLNQFRYHLKVATWSLLRSRSFAVASIGTLTIALSVFVAAMSIYNSYVMRPLSYPKEAEVLVVKQATRVEGKEADEYQTVRGLQHWYREQTALNQFTLVATSSDLITNLDGAPRLQVSFVTPQYFAVLGVPLVLGRTMNANEDLDQQSRVALIGERAWVELYRRDPAVLGKEITVGKKSHTIIGVVASSFKEPHLFDGGRAEVWLPFDAGDHYNAPWDSTYASVHALGRVGAGGVEAAEREFANKIADIRSEWSSEWPQLESVVPRMTPLREAELGDSRRFSLIMLLGAATLLGIAVINVATLFMARAVQQAESLRVRVIVGATRRQLLVTQGVEAALVVVVAIALSFTFSPLLLAGFRALAASSVPLTQGIALTWHVWLYAAALASLLVAIFVMVVNASFNVSSIGGKRHGSGKGATATYSKSWARALLGLELYLIVTVLALSGSALVASARPLLRSMHWSPDNVVHLFAFTSNETAGPGEKALLYQKIEQRLASMRQIDQIALGAPLISEKRVAFSVSTEDGESLGFVRANAAGANYFKLFGIDIVEGREFSAAALRGDAKELIVTQDMAKMFAPGGGALGRTLVVNDQMYEVVGIAENVNEPRHFGEDGSARLWRPQAPTFYPMNIKLRVGATLDRDAAAQLLKEIDPSLMIWEYFDLEEELAKSLRPSRIVLYVASALAVFGMVLSVIGIWGITGYLLGLQTRELAVYRALGMDSARFRGWLLRVFGPAIGAALMLVGLSIWLLASSVSPPLDEYLSLSFVGSLAAGMVGLTVIASTLAIRGGRFMGMSISRALTGDA